jgi:hypothetical protein
MFHMQSPTHTLYANIKIPLQCRLSNIKIPILSPEDPVQLFFSAHNEVCTFLNSLIFFTSFSIILSQTYLYHKE